MIRLTGAQNPVIKEIRSLRSKNGREERGLYFIEGTRFVEEAVKELTRGADLADGSEYGYDSGLPSGILNAAADMVYIAVSETFFEGAGSSKYIEPCISNGVKIYCIADSLFESISDTRNPQGILAVMQLRKAFLKDIRLAGGIVVILDNIRDPGNLGTIIRTADAAGCAGVILTDGCVELYNPKVLRSTMGSVFHIPVIHGGSMRAAMAECKDKGYVVCASHLEGSVGIYDADLSGNTALVIGSEAGGISNEALHGADMLVRIPMQGKAESLNAAVAAGIMIFEAVRQRTEESK